MTYAKFVQIFFTMIVVTTMIFDTALGQDVIDDKEKEAINKLIENARAFIMVTMIGWEDSKAPAICLKQRDNRPSNLTVIPRSEYRAIHSNGGLWSRFKRMKR